MSKFLGFLLGIVAALAGPAAFGVLTADGGIELNAKEMALAYGIGALIFWTVVSYFSGAAALGAALTFGAMIYAVHWIPNRTTNFLNDVPGVTTGMIGGLKAYTLNGVVPILAVVSLVYAIQLIVRSVRRRRLARAEAERRQREQEAAQAQQEAEVAAVYAPPPAEYAAPADNRFQNFGNTSYDDLFDEEPAPVQPRSQADEYTTQFPAADARTESAPEHTAVVGAVSNDIDETVQANPDPDETQQVPAAEPQITEAPVAEAPETEAPVVDAPEPEAPEAEDENDEPPPPPAGATAVGMTGAPAATEPEAEAPQSEAPTQNAPKAEAPTQETPKPEQPKAEQPKPAEASPKDTGQQQAIVRPKEEVGQQYRERMDDPKDTGEFFVGQFRPAGA